jgi:hypothetical protein
MEALKTAFLENPPEYDIVEEDDEEESSNDEEVV